MADFTAIAIIIGIVTIIPLYFILSLYPKTAFVMLSIVIAISMAVGFSLSTGEASKTYFEVALILSLISLPIAILHFILNNAKEILLAIPQRGL